jgi:hypothetical protein
MGFVLLVNYADWGALSSVSPFSWFKATHGEGGGRPPMISVSVIYYCTGKLKKRSRWTTITLYQTADRIKAYIW